MSCISQLAPRLGESGTQDPGNLFKQFLGSYKKVQNLKSAFRVCEGRAGICCLSQPLSNPGNRAYSETQESSHTSNTRENARKIPSPQNSFLIRLFGNEGLCLLHTAVAVSDSDIRD